MFFTILSVVVGYIAFGVCTYLVARRRGQTEPGSPAFVAHIVVWPIALITLVREPYGSADPDKAFTRVPRCTSLIQYAAETPSGTPLPGTFTFRASDVETAFLRQRPQHIHAHLLRRWLAERDESSRDLVAVPDLLSNCFSQIVEPLVMDNRALAVFCRECGRVVDSPDVANDHFELRPGWNSDSYLCSNGHKLYSIHTVHVLMHPPQPKPNGG